MQASTIFPETVILGIYFSNDRCDTDLAPVYIPRIVKSMTEKGHAEPCMVVQLKNSLLENLDMFCINVSFAVGNFMKCICSV